MLVEKRWEPIEIRDVDAVVIVSRSRLNLDLKAASESCPTTVIGDAMRPGKVSKAIEDGFQTLQQVALGWRNVSARQSGLKILLDLPELLASYFAPGIPQLESI